MLIENIIIFFNFTEAMAHVLNEREQSQRKWDEYEKSKKKTISQSLKRFDII